MVQEVQLGTTAEFVFTVVDEGGNIVDVSNATTKDVCLKDPSGNVSVNVASFVTDGTDGKLFYKALVTDLDETGTWTAQGKAVIPTGTYPTKITSFKVVKNICS